ncbi:MAG: Unknown protein [uncultured Thiotrichaceae bacterium]|uniref:DUF4332 domain-containing protein n=1 Tax=uncultured Thiotrichaceae bacterium TaxID=298394 RepID=A0A6S6UKI7_9GAMM|nr:MAG: Unknown protein [uncultured Thiotrichaceae bacterium]
MSYLLTQLWICLGLAALIAGIAGWLLRGSGRNKFKKIEDEMNAKLVSVEKERDHYMDELQNLGEIEAETKALTSKHIEEKQTLEKQLQGMEKAASMASQKLHLQEQELTKKAQQLNDANASLSMKIDEEQQVFTQRLAEVEAGAEHSDHQIKEYEVRIDALEAELSQTASQLDEARIQLSEIHAASRVALGTSAVSYINTPAISTAADKTVLSDSEGAHDDANIKGLLGIGGLAGVAGLAKSTLDKAVEGVSHAKEEMMYKSSPGDTIYALNEIKSISREDRSRLNEMGVETTEELLNKCSTKDEISLFSKTLGKEAWVVRSWVSVADLLRLNGVDGMNAELLELSGIASTQSLKLAKAEKLQESMSVIHRHVGKNDSMPELSEIQTWIAQASNISPMVDNSIEKI